MSQSVNKVMLIGNMVHDPELKFLPSGAACCEFALALNNSYTKKDGQKVEEVCYADVTCWQKLAEIVAEHCKKGKQVFVEGRLKQDRWEKDGKKFSRLKIQAEQVVFLGKKGEAPEPLVVPESEEAPF
jgi:single-strand DNA-binding protein